MSVFLRWGIFGILGVAALVYAYYASKDLAEKRAAASAPVAATPQVESETPEIDQAETGPAAPEPGPEPAPVKKAAPHCEAELVVAQLALDARRAGEPLDRLLRVQEIAWQEPRARQQRLEEVATRWYQMDGEDPIPEALRIRVISDCEHFSPAP